MAEDLDDGEFWLPSQFLTEEDILTDFSTTGFNSELASPGESGTETDEDDFFAELTRRISRSSLLQPKDGLVLSRSPQSTLLPLGGSSRGSPTGPVSPPPAKEGYFNPGNASSASFDLLNAAAGEVAKLRMRTEQQQQQMKGTGYFDSSRGFQYPPPVKHQIRPAAFHAFFPHPHHQPPQSQQFQQVNRTEKPVFFLGARAENHLPNRPLGLSPAAWPPLQHPLNRRTPAPAQSIPVPKRETVGTGVFLPRRVDGNPNPTQPESRKIKNKNDSTGRHGGQGNGFRGQRRGQSTENAQSKSIASTEIRLPSEWTY